MNIQEYINNLTNGKADDLSVKRMKKIMKLLGNPQDNLKFIHITGTNGKGSCIEMLNNILVKSGLKVGKFISPHLTCYNERISINGKNIKDEEIQNIYEKIQPFIEKENLEISYFEFFTVISFMYFYQQKVDIVLMEVGVGGLYDSTNIINPMISVITSVGYDHTQILGKTIEEIAIQKAGIIKQCSETVYMEQEPKIDNIIIQTCKEKHSTLHVISKLESKNMRFENSKEIFDYRKYHNMEINLKGKRQIQNATIVLECCDILKNKGYCITEDSIRQGLKTVIHKARFETIYENPTIIFDGGHNEQAIQNLKETINIYYGKTKKIYVISVLKSKDFKTILDDVMEDGNIYIFTNGNDENRYVENYLMYDYAKQISQNVEVYKMELEEAIRFCEKKTDCVSFVIGSFYIYNDVINMLINI